MRHKENRNFKPGCEGTPVVLIRMPFAALNYPSIGLSLLKAVLEREGIPSQTLYLTFEFAKEVGIETYELISRLTGEDQHYMAGDWVFAEDLYDSPGLFQTPEFVFKDSSKQFANHVRKMRRKVRRFLELSLQRVLELNPRVVGFSCVYQQKLSSLSLAKIIKSRNPDVFIVLGGPECEGVKGAEIIRRYPFIDAVVSGEGDIVFPEVVKNVLSDKRQWQFQGVFRQGEKRRVIRKGQCQNAPILQNLDLLPFVDYDDYFEQLRSSGLKPPEDKFILVEASRGCWWARCRFCSLNGAQAMYRRKSSGRVMEELDYLIEKYGGKIQEIAFVDNALDKIYLKDLLPALADRSIYMDFFFEVRTDLNKVELSILRDAGVKVIQPGIESLSSPVLRLMRKGSDGIRNIQFLKWSKELGIETTWNIIHGFPGETKQDYKQMANLVPSLSHLDPPRAFGPMVLGRYSPYFESAKRLGLRNIRPDPAYNDIFPFGSKAIENLAQYFLYDYSQPTDAREGIDSLQSAVEGWRSAYPTSTLFSMEKDGKLLIWDGRGVSVEPLTVLSGVTKALYKTCDEAQKLTVLRDFAEAKVREEWSLEDVKQLLQPLLERRLMIQEGDRYLSLAIPLGVYRPFPEQKKRFDVYVRRMEEMEEQYTFLSSLRVAELSKDTRVSEKEVIRAVNDIKDGALSGRAIPSAHIKDD